MRADRSELIRLAKWSFNSSALTLRLSGLTRVRSRSRDEGIMPLGRAGEDTGRVEDPTLPVIAVPLIGVGTLAVGSPRS